MGRDDRARDDVCAQLQRGLMTISECGLRIAELGTSGGSQ